MLGKDREQTSSALNRVLTGEENERLYELRNEEIEVLLDEARRAIETANTAPLESLDQFLARAHGAARLARTDRRGSAS
jgi:hypothetical protein